MPVLNVAITGPDGVACRSGRRALRVLPIMGQDPNGPNRQGGYQHDARFGTLQEQARGALFAHAQVSVEPPARMLDDLAAFQQTLFSSPGVELLADAILSGSTPFPDPDPELNELEQQGKVVFNRACAQCHGGTLHPSRSTPEAAIVRPIVRYHNIQTACPRPATDGFAPCPERLARNARTYRITLANGTFQTVTTSDPGRLLLTGQPADLGVMDVTQLRGISKTAPYFHNNSAATLEEVLDHYDAFFRRVARLNPPPNLPPILSSERPRRRSRIRVAGRAGGVAGVPPKAVEPSGDIMRKESVAKIQKQQMNLWFRSLGVLPAHAWFGFVSLVRTVLMVCFLASATNVHAQSGWSATGSLATGRHFHTAVLLSNGKVLVAGGIGPNAYFSTATAELYDPATGQWSATGSMSRPRECARRRAVDQWQSSRGGRLQRNSLRRPETSAEIYDPESGTWSAAGSLSVARGASHSATLLADGRVLVTGGYEAELYDPATGCLEPGRNDELTSPPSYGHVAA